MFAAKGTITAVPVMIQCFFFWAVAICLVRWLRLRSLAELSKPTLMAEVNRALSASTPAAIAAQLETPVASASPLLRRVRTVLRQWTLRPGLPNANLALQEHVTQDEESMRAGYGVIRAFVWVLPVLGLIGTAIGIAIAVGGFATFLGSDVEDFRVVKQHLLEVTSGLSFAFLMTLEGLLTALLAMLACSALQTREERLYGRVQRKLTETFLPALQRFAPAEGTEGGSMLDPALLEQMMDRMVGGVVNAVSTCIDARERERRKEIADLGQAMQNVSQQIAAQAHAVAEASQAVGGLAGATQTAIGMLSPLQEAIQQTGASLGHLTTGLGAVQAGQQTLTQSTEQLGAALAQWKADSAVNNLASALQAVRDSLVGLAPVLAGFRGPFVFQAVPKDDSAKGTP
jgi:biopolymer transport protein ExbB/TolQ